LRGIYPEAHSFALFFIPKPIAFIPKPMAFALFYPEAHTSVTQIPWIVDNFSMVSRLPAPI